MDARFQVRVIAIGNIELRLAWNAGAMANKFDSRAALCGIIFVAFSPLAKRALRRKPRNHGSPDVEAKLKSKAHTSG